MSVPPEYDGDLGTYDETRKLLDYVVQAAVDFHAPIPDRQYVNTGEAAIDCEQVTATLIGAQTGIAGAVTAPGPVVFTGGCPLPWMIIVDIMIARCVPALEDDGEAPPAAELEDDAKLRAMDTFLLQEAARRRGDERHGGVGCLIQYPAPEGKFAAVVGRFNVQVST